MGIAKSLGGRIKAYREALALKPADLARLSGVSAPQISRYEADKIKNPEVETLVAISKALGVRVDQLLGVEDGGGSGLKPEELEILGELRDAFREIGPGIYSIALSDIRRHKKDFLALISSRSNESLSVSPVAPNTRRVNRRDEILSFTITKRASANTVKLPLWYSAACGSGRELERSPDYLYFRELPDWKGVHSVVVQGESMCDTLVPKDIVLLQEIGEGGLALSEIKSEDEKTTLMIFRKYIAHDDICLLSINDEEPTLKRIKIQPGHNGTDWTLLVVADNPAEWEPRSITRKTAIRIYAKLIGRAKREGE
ncbi:MAG: helix-turn-helix domain-containing protein [Planctomycetes bacterium]|nr:helix-turn-helix domain-containing protein [Planctomycetota bacterium]